MIPQEQRQILLKFIDEAVSFACKGQAMHGYYRLDLGLSRAESARRRGEPWADELIACYQMALVRYSEESGILWKPLPNPPNDTSRLPEDSTLEDPS